ncbi:MAG: SPOR domain-containing protein [Salinivirgaceae bacterium]|nr:SPOR domain-containing protein [Salinivirgaceae bacterium]
MTLTKIKSLVLIMLFVPVVMFADEPNTKPSIVEEITADGDNSVVMPDKLLQRLLPSTGKESSGQSSGESVKKVGKKIVGYRVQIFSSNNAKSAKSEASSKARQSMSRFPQYRSYVTYSSPYWKVRVGDFQTSQEASSAAAALRGTFGSQVCVVRDYVNAK